MSSQTDREEEIVEERQRACGWLFTSLMYSHSKCVTCLVHSMSGAGEDTRLLTQVAYTHVNPHTCCAQHMHNSRSMKRNIERKQAGGGERGEQTDQERKAFNGKKKEIEDGGEEEEEGL